MNKIILSVISVLFAISAYAQEEAKQSIVTTRTIVIQEKNPAAAFLLSSIYPGTGQMYNGQVGKGLVFALGIPACVIIGASLSDDLSSSGYYRIGFFVLAGGGYIYQMINAPIRSAKLNKKNGFYAQKQHKIQLGLSSHSVGLGLKVKL